MARVRVGITASIEVHAMTKRGRPTVSTARRLPGAQDEAPEGFGLPMTFIVVKAMEEFLDRMIDPSEFRLTRDQPIHVSR